MGELFADFEPYSVVETRRVSKEEGHKVGREEHLVEQVCKKLKKSKTVKQIANELEEDEARVEAICEVAEKYASEYDVAQILKDLGITKEDTEE